MVYFYINKIYNILIFHVDKNGIGIVFALFIYYKYIEIV